MYKQFMANPETNSVRNLASRYHLSIKRVEAILRLKGLEAHWIKVRNFFIVAILCSPAVEACDEYKNRLVLKTQALLDWLKLPFY